MSLSETWLGLRLAGLFSASLEPVTSHTHLLLATVVHVQHLDFFGGRRPSEEEALQFQAHVEEAADDRVVFLSDVWLDKPSTHDRLRAIFEGTPSHRCACQSCGHRAGCLFPKI